MGSGGRTPSNSSSETCVDDGLLRGKAAGVAAGDLEQAFVGGLPPAEELKDAHTDLVLDKEAQAKLTSAEDVLLVWFEPGEDPSRYGDYGDPMLWSRRRKWTLSLVLYAFALYAPWAGASLSIGIEDLRADLGASVFLGALAEGLYPAGFGCGPLLLAPMSEEIGRLPVYIGALGASVLLNIPTALSPNITGVCICRFLGGMAASVGSTLVGGSLSDVWATEERGLHMSLFALMSFVGIPLGIISNGFVVARLGWTWILWIQTAFGGAIFIFVCLTMRESRSAVILRKRARKLRQQTGDGRYRAISEDGPTVLQLVLHSLTRPLVLLFTEPAVAALSLWIGLIWAIIWGLIGAIPRTFRDVYGFDVGEQGLAWTGLLIGTFLGYALSFWQEQLYHRNYPKRGVEARLYASMIGGVALAIGCIIFGAAQGRTHWVVPEIGLAVLYAGAFSIFLAVFNYMADCYLIYASSALAAQSLLRNMAGFMFPLIINPWLDAVGITWTSITIGFISLLFAVLPFIFFWKGPAIRARSKMCQQLEREMLAAREGDKLIRDQLSKEKEATV